MHPNQYLAISRITSVNSSTTLSFSRTKQQRFILGILLVFASQVGITADNLIHIRTLAASCAACHGTNGNSQSITPVLAGLDAQYFSTQMLAFKNGERANNSTVMHHHASGLTEAEIDALADFFSAQARVSGTPLKPQTLGKNDE